MPKYATLALGIAMIVAATASAAGVRRAAPTKPAGRVDRSTAVTWHVWNGPVPCVGTPDQVWHYPQGCSHVSTPNSNLPETSVLRRCVSLEGRKVAYHEYTYNVSTNCSGTPASTFTINLGDCNSFQWAFDVAVCPVLATLP